MICEKEATRLRAGWRQVVRFKLFLQLHVLQLLVGREFQVSAEEHSSTQNSSLFLDNG